MAVQYQIISIVGPTASGKSGLADRVAIELNGEVVSADSMQVYRGMDIGTAKTPKADRQVTIHGIDLIDVGEPFSAALFGDRAHEIIDHLIAESKVPIVCGGTGLYMRAALEEMGFPSGEQTDNPIRTKYESLASTMSAEVFHDLLKERDPQSAALIHPNNVRRVIRAFELLEQGSSYAQEHETFHERSDRLPTLHIGLTMPREILYERINRRVDIMLESGLVEEVKRLVCLGLGDTLTARQAIGYKEIIDYLEGNRTLEDAVEEIKRSSRRYAKRQYTWFNADKRIVWLDMSTLHLEEAVQIVIELFRSSDNR